MAASPSGQHKTLTVEQKKDKQPIKKLERELMRKDKALAETAPLLVLTKKAREIWGELIKQAVKDGARQSKACETMLTKTGTRRLSENRLPCAATAPALL